MKRRLSMFICGLLAASAVASSSSVSALAAPKIDPYKINQAEVNFGTSGVEVETEGSIKYLSGLEAGDYFMMKDVDFADGLAKLGGSFRASSVSVLEVRVDALDGETLGNIKLSDTNGEFTTVYAKSKYLTGKHVIYFVGVMGSIDIDYWAALATPGSQPIEPDPVEPDPIVEPDPDAFSPYEVVEAENGRAVNATVKTEGNVTYVAGLTTGTLLDSGKAAFDGSAAIGITFRTTDVAIVEVRDGRLAGDKLATLRIGNSEGQFKTSYFAFPSLEGEHSLFFVTRLGSVDLDSWTVMKPPVKPNPNPDPEDPDPVDPDPVDPDPVDPDPVDPDPVDPEPIDEPDPIEEPVAEGIVAEYTINNWGTGYQVQFKVKNDSDKRAETWALKVKKSDIGIDSYWNVNIDEEDKYYVITPVAWNAVIEPGKSVEFGVQGSSNIKDKIEVLVEGQATSEDPTPEPIDDPEPVDPDPVDPDPVDPDPVDPEPIDDPDPIVVINDDLALEYTINGQGSYTINFKVVNNSTSQVNGWTLKLLKSEVKIDSSWCVKVVSDGAYYVITPESWNSTINAGDGAYFGIQGSGTIAPKLTYELN